MSVTRMSRKGQVVIPAAIRRALDLRKSSRLRVEIRDGAIVLVPLDDDWRSLRGSAAGSS